MPEFTTKLRHVQDKVNKMSLLAPRRIVVLMISVLLTLSLWFAGAAVAMPETASEDDIVSDAVGKEDEVLERVQSGDTSDEDEYLEEETEETIEMGSDEDAEAEEPEQAAAGNGSDLVPEDGPETRATVSARASSSIAGFRRENIISDQSFYNSTTMSEIAIRQFIQRENGSCRSTSNAQCIKDAVFPTQNLTTLRGACKPLNLKGNQPAWTIISRTAVACGLNPQVILATIQKESSGIYQPLTAAQWSKAMGSGCPDGSGCSAAQSGFTKQIYYGADKLASYRLDSSWVYIGAVANGKAVAIKNAPGCSSTSTVKIANNATASLYMYTPYTPSDAQIAAYPATVNCGHPGYLTFYKYMKQWFPGSVGPSTPASKAKVVRISGQDRVGTAIAVSKHEFSKANVVYLVNQLTPVDAMVAGTLPNGPILYTSKTKLPAATLAEINRLGAKKVVVIGGNGVISDSLVSQLKSRGFTTSRLGGTDRIATAIAISKYLYPNGKPKSVYVAGAFGPEKQGSPDAVAGANLTDGPILLTYENRALDSRTRAEMARLNSKVYELGGQGLGTGGTKISGSDRYKTSEQIAKRAYGNVPSTVYLVRGDNPVDAVAAGTLTKGPRLLVHPKLTAFAQCSYLKAARPKTIYVVGGVGAVSDNTANYAAACVAGH